MTRKSERELERAVEALADDVNPADLSGPELTAAQREAVREVCRYRRETYPDGDTPGWAAVVQEALEEIPSGSAAALRELLADRTGASA